MLHSTQTSFAGTTSQFVSFFCCNSNNPITRHVYADNHVTPGAPPNSANNKWQHQHTSDTNATAATFAPSHSSLAKLARCFARKSNLPLVRSSSTAMRSASSSDGVALHRPIASPRYTRALHLTGAANNGLGHSHSEDDWTGCAVIRHAYSVSHGSPFYKSEVRFQSTRCRLITSLLVGRSLFNVFYGVLSVVCIPLAIAVSHSFLRQFRSTRFCFVAALQLVTLKQRRFHRRSLNSIR